jgi:hypothetical protein
MSYVLPNYAGQLVSQARTDVEAHQLTLRVSTGGDDPYHAPNSSELQKTVTANGPNSQPGSLKNAGEWVGAVIPI